MSNKSFDVPQNVRKEAERGLRLRKEHGRGGLSTQEAGAHGIGSGVQRASDLVQGRVSFKTVKRMLAFFNRHKGYKKHHTTNPPSNSLISWLLWGGDSGFAWAKRIVDREMNKRMYTFNELVWFAKAQGHKYIKRIPVGTTASGRTRYRYIYSTTSTVGGKHLLDEAHLKVGTKLMLHSKSGEEVHAHIESVNGNKVTIRYDDGDKKGQIRTVSKKDLLKEFNEEHGVGKDLKEAHESAKQDLKTAKESGATDKQLKRIQDRIDRTKLKEEKKVKKEKKQVQEPVQAINDEARKILESYGDDYDTEIKDYNLLASQNLDFKRVDKALSKPIYDDVDSTVYRLPNGTMIAVGKQVDENGMRKVQGRYLNDEQIIAYEVDAGMLKGDPKKLAQACFIAMHQPDDDDPTQVVQYQELIADNLEEYRQGKNFEKLAQSAIALANFEKLEQKQAPDQAEAPAPVASYDDLSKQQKKMLHSSIKSKGTSYRLPITEKVIAQDELLTTTNGHVMNTVPLTDDTIESTLYDKNGKVTDIQHEIGVNKKSVPFKGSISAVIAEMQTTPAFTLTAKESKKLKDLINSTKNLENTDLVIQPQKQAGKIDIRYAGVTIATLDHIGDHAHKQKHAVAGKYLAHALSNGANTIHLSTGNKYLKVTNKDVESHIMQVLVS